MRVDERFHEEVKELRQLEDEFPSPSQSDVIRKAVTLALKLRREEVAWRGKSK
jgi:Arc/MetJ-type ribon-helix-helix transcriptional regulator